MTHSVSDRHYEIIMAIVRGEGSVWIFDTLLTAMLGADFSGTQLRILLALLRLTHGCKRSAARLSMTSLARCAGLPPGEDSHRASGYFRRAMRDLIDAGVVLELEAGVGGRLSLFALETNPDRWRGFAADTLCRYAVSDSVLQYSQVPTLKGGRRSRLTGPSVGRSRSAFSRT